MTLQYTYIDLWDTLGTNLQNVTKDITKWSVDKDGTRKEWLGHNRVIKKVKHETHHEDALEHIANANGGELHATDLTPDTISNFYKEHKMAIIDYFAPWCIHCQRLAPTWENVAAEISKKDIPLGVGKVDCVVQQQMCKDERIMAYPTIRWYQDGAAVAPDYRGDRTLGALLDYAKQRVGKSGDDDDEEEVIIEEHPGCEVSGHLKVNRVPGNLHMEAKSTNHEINSQMTNLTHRVNHFSFGAPNGPSGHFLDFLPIFNDIPKEYRHTNPMKDKYYPTYHFHQAFHHHLKIISVHQDYFIGSAVVYEILEESQLVMYEVMNVPEIKFLYDMSPMSVNLEKESIPWYDCKYGALQLFQLVFFMPRTYTHLILF